MYSRSVSLLLLCALALQLAAQAHARDGSECGRELRPHLHAPFLFHDDDEHSSGESSSEPMVGRQPGVDHDDDALYGSNEFQASRRAKELGQSDDLKSVLIVGVADGTVRECGRVPWPHVPKPAFTIGCPLYLLHLQLLI